MVIVLTTKHENDPNKRYRYFTTQLKSLNPSNKVQNKNPQQENVKPEKNERKQKTHNENIQKPYFSSWVVIVKPNSRYTKKKKIKEYASYG